MNSAPIDVSSCQPLPPAQPFAAAAPVRAPVSTNQFTTQVIRQLLDGVDAATFAAIPLASYGPWAEVVRLLLEAYAEGKASATADTGWRDGAARRP